MPNYECFFNGKKRNIVENPDEAPNMFGGKSRWGDSDASVFGFIEFPGFSFGFVSDFGISQNHPNVVYTMRDILNMMERTELSPMSIMFWEQWRNSMKKYGVIPVYTENKIKTDADYQKLKSSVERYRDTSGVRKEMNIPGRLWKNGKVISVWRTRKTADMDALKMIMNVYKRVMKVPVDDFRVEFLDDYDATWSELVKYTDALKGKKPEEEKLTDDQIANLMKKKHLGQQLTSKEKDVVKRFAKKFGSGKQADIAKKAGFNSVAQMRSMLQRSEETNNPESLTETVNVLRSLIVEGRQEDAVIDLVKKAIKGTRFNKKLYIAGGYVRDELMGKKPKDVDILVDGDSLNDATNVSDFLAQTFGVYKKGSNPIVFPAFGTAKLTLAYPNEKNKKFIHNGVDITGYDLEFVVSRKEKYKEGSRKPEVSKGTLKDDAERRDFTINSLLKNLTTNEILDLTGMGRDDLKKKVIRTSLDPNIIFSEDPLRLLRAVRFAAKYDFELPIFMRKAMIKNAKMLDKISAERVRAELEKMLLIDKPSKAMKLLKNTKLLPVILPELQDLIKLKQNKHHKEDAFVHTLSVLDNTPPEITRRLGALFHDIGKKATQTDINGKVQFIGHDEVGSEITKEIMKRLKYSNNDIDKITTIVKNHMKLKHGGDDAIQLKDKHLRKFIHMVADKLEPALDVIHADNIAHADQSAMPNQIKYVKQRIKDWNLNSIIKPKLPINGLDLIDLGIPEGKIRNIIMDRVKQKYLENPELTKDTALHMAKQMALAWEKKQKVTEETLTESQIKIKIDRQYFSMADDDPNAYKQLKTNQGIETKPSKHTQKYQQMYGESKEAIQNKAKETGIPYDILKQVYDRGMAAWKTGHRPGTTPHQWAIARINSFATGGKTRTTADKDLWQKYKELNEEKISKDGKFYPPKAAQENAKKVLKWRDKLGRDEVDAMTPVGWARANQLASGDGVSFTTVKRMAAFQRHKKNAKISPEYKDTPWKDKGYVAYLGWGGDEGINWAIEMVKKVENQEKDK